MTNMMRKSRPRTDGFCSGRMGKRGPQQPAKSPGETGKSPSECANSYGVATSGAAGQLADVIEAWFYATPDERRTALEALDLLDT